MSGLRHEEGHFQRRSGHDGAVTKPASVSAFVTAPRTSQAPSSLTVSVPVLPAPLLQHTGAQSGAPLESKITREINELARPFDSLPRLPRLFERREREIETHTPIGQLQTSNSLFLSIRISVCSGEKAGQRGRSPDS